MIITRIRRGCKSFSENPAAGSGRSVVLKGFYPPKADPCEHKNPAGRDEKSPLRPSPGGLYSTITRNPYVASVTMLFATHSGHTASTVKTPLSVIVICRLALHSYSGSSGWRLSE